jgi:hypothetical protein
MYSFSSFKTQIMKVEAEAKQHKTTQHKKKIKKEEDE